MSRAKSRRNLGFEEVLEALKQQGISIRVASPKLVMEEVNKKFNFLNKQRGGGTLTLFLGEGS